MVDLGTWESDPLPLFIEGVEGVMRPSEYEKLLPGAIAQIAFIPKYTQVKTTANIMKTSFATIIQEIIVLKKPLAPTSQPAADAPSHSVVCTFILSEEKG